MTIKDNTLSLQSILDTVNNLPTGSTSVLQTKTIVPSATSQTIKPDTGYNGLSSVTIEGDVDLVASNIKKDVNIFGVTGSLEGMELNFEIVGGTTQPTNPTENMIWVNTDVEITGWYFTPEQPENMADGEVWFCTDKTGDISFDAVKKNNLTVYFKSAKQYVSGALKDVNVKIYQGETWVELITYVSLSSLITGFTATRESGTGSATIKDGTVTASTSDPAPAQGNVVYYGNKTINLSEYKTMTYYAKRSGLETPELRVGVHQNTSPKYYWNITKGNIISTGAEKQYSFDLSSITGNYYFCIAMTKLTYDGSVSVTIRDVRFYK